MEKKNWKRIVYHIVQYLMLACFIAGIVVILVLAGQTGTVSSQQSGTVTQVVQETITVVTGTTIPKETLDPIVRKVIGHYLMFLCTGLCGLIYCLMTFKSNRFRLISVGVLSLIGFLVAMISEWIQSMTPDRGPSWSDVGIDTGGYMTTIVIAMIIMLILFLIKTHKEKNNQNNIQPSN